MAINLVQRHYSPIMGDLRRQQSDALPDGQISFRRFVNGIPVWGDGVSVFIDPHTLQWTMISAAMTPDASFPEPHEVVTPEAAMDAFLAANPPTLVYSYGLERVGFALAPRYQLAWPTIDRRYDMVDAVTGGMLDQTGQTRSDATAVNAKLDGHPAEGALRYLLTARVLSAPELSPDEPITRTQAEQILLAGRLGLEGEAALVVARMAGVLR